MEKFLSLSETLAKIFDKAPLLFILYFIIVNIAAFMLYYIDKQKAKKHLWRIPESTLLLSAAIGGSIGAFFAMKIFRHKTKHPKFYITIPLFMLIHLLLIIMIITGKLH